jgi:hypothetical protein
MFALALIFIAIPGSLIVLIMAYAVARLFKLMPTGMSFDWLALPTLGLAAGGAIAGFTVEEFVIRPFQLQDEMLGRQLVTPLTLRSYSAWGFQDPGWTWTYEIGAAQASQLAHHCRTDRFFRGLICAGIGDGDRDASIVLEGTTLSIQESFM